MTRYISERIIVRLIKFKGNCCNSCHEDADEFNYGMVYEEFGKGRESEVCCAVSNALDAWKEECEKGGRGKRG